VHVQWLLNLVRVRKTAGAVRRLRTSALGASTESASMYQRSKARREAASVRFN
jgi:hypothetical protein